MADGGYSFEVEGPVWQHDEHGQLRKIDGADIDPSRPWYWTPEEYDTEQGDEPAELGPEWQDIGLYEPGIPVSVEEVRRTAEAIEVLARVPGEHTEATTRGALTGLSIAEHRPIPRPLGIRLPERLGGLPEDAPEQDRYRVNRADRRRLAKRGRRR